MKLRPLLLSALCLLPSAAPALRVDNCDGEPHEVTVIYSGEERSFTLAPGESRFLPGIPLELRAGEQIRRPLDYDDEWCLWKGGELKIQKRGLHRRGGR